MAAWTLGPRPDWGEVAVSPERAMPTARAHRRTPAYVLSGLLLCGLTLAWADLAQPTHTRPLGPPAADPPGAAPVLDYTPPPPGSYELMRIMQPGDGRVLDIHGRPRRLAEFTTGKITLLSFIYSHCADPGGCPYVQVVFHDLRNRLAQKPQLARRVRLVSLSFDPQRDTPELLRLYAGDSVEAGQPVEWCYLTTAGLSELIPILEDFGQDVFVEIDPVSHSPMGTYSHTLKLFLLDARGTVREVYTTATLHPQAVYHDILTLLLEEDGLLYRDAPSNP